MHTLGRVIALLAITGSVVLAQETRGTLLGRVIDSSDAIIPGVEVRAVNRETGTTAAGRSNDSGNYVVPYLLPGTYTVQAELTGFKRFSREGVQIRVNDSVTVDITMTPGQVAEIVEVRGATPLMETSSASIGQVVDQKRIAELPLMGGSPFALVMLSPGTVNTGGMRYRDATRPNANSQFTTDGNRQYSNEFAIDGVPNMASYGTEARVAFIPPVSAVAEFKVQTISYDASLGHTAGAVINVSTTGGTNKLHGEVHEFFRNRVLDAPSFFNNRAGQSLPVYQYNRIGFAAGGPVYIPGKYSGKNRTFWFYAYENNPNTEPQPATFSIPDLAERRGDFSGLLKLGSQYQIYDPATIGAEAGGRFRRGLFPGNIVPQSRIDPLARRLGEYWPQPNQAGTSDGRNNFFNGQQRNTKNYFVHIGRFDHAFSDNHRLFIRVNYDWLELDKEHNFYNDVNGIYWNTINKGAGLDDVLVFSPTFTLNLRYGFGYMVFPCHRTSRGIDLGGLGFSKELIALAKPGAPLPYIDVGGFRGFAIHVGEEGVRSSMTHQLSGNFSRLARAHMMRFGAEYRNTRANTNMNPTADVPDISFGTTWTRGPLDNSTAAPIGQDMASFLLGLPTGGSMMRSAGGDAAQDQFVALYWQDDWKLSPKLTVNLGLRYEHETPITERFDRTADQFDFSVTNPIEAAAKAKYAAAPIPELSPSAFQARGGLLFAGVNGRPRTLWDPQKRLLMPRFGFAWAPRAATVLRGGYGIFYDSVGTSRNQTLQYGFNATTPLVASLDNGLTYIASLANPFPSGLNPIIGAAGGYSTYVGQSVSFFPRNIIHPYAQRWSLGIQRQFLKEFLVEVAYVGNRGTRLPVGRQNNSVPAQWFSRLPVRDQAAIDFLSAQVRNPFAGLLPNTSLNGVNVARSQLLRPYPEFFNIGGQQPQGYSWYHAMQLRAEKRFSKGYTLNLAYTWSKAMEAVSFLNETEPLPERVIGGNDTTHRLVLSGIYELPFGKGRPFGSSARGVWNALFGGWQVQAIVTRQSGMPLGFGNSIFNGNLKDIVLPRDQRDVDRWFNVDAGFERNSSKQLGSNIRTMPSRFGGIRNDGQSVWDASALKNFSIAEKMKLQFRGEAYNALNHPNFGGPGTSPTSTSFGKITSQEGNPRQWQLALKLTF